MLDVALKNELPDDWIKEIKEKVLYAETPHLLWNQNEKVEQKMFSHPEFIKKKIEYTNSLIDLSNEKYLLNLVRT